MLRVRQVVLIFAYLAALIAVAPVFLYLDRPVQLLALLALAAGLLADRRNRVLLAPLPGTLLAILAFAVCLLQFSLANPVQPIVNLLVLLLALRLVGDKAPRNILQIFVLALFALAASSLLTLSLTYFGYLLALTVVLAVGLVLLGYFSADPAMLLRRRELRTIFAWSALLPAGSLLLMLVFFAILPRTNYPLWNFLNPAPTARAGFSEQVRPGSFAALAADPTTAFRAETERLPPDQLYWRGTVLNQLTGSSWQRQTPPPRDLATPHGPAIHQQIFLEPRQDRFLPALDLPYELELFRHEQEGDFVHLARRALTKRSRYRVEARPEARLELASPAAAARYLQLPADIAPQLRAVARDIRIRGRTRLERIELLETFFVERQLTYAAQGLQPSTTPVESFLFESRRGYCEYFAAAFGLLARLSDVPARLVGGYLGGEYNPVGGYYQVSEEMAHVWVEVLDENDRWLRVDPSRLAVNAEAGLLAPRRRQTPWLTGLIDSLEHAWNRTVIGYDLQQQLSMLRGARDTLQQVRLTPGGWTPWLFLLPVFMLILVLHRRRHRRPGSPNRRLAERFLRLAERNLGVRLPPGSGLQQVARRLRHPLAEQFADRYGELVYRDRTPGLAERRELKQLLADLERQTGGSGPPRPKSADPP